MKPPASGRFVLCRCAYALDRTDSTSYNVRERTGGMERRILSFGVSEQDFEDMQQMAREQYRNVSQVLRMIVLPEIERWRKERQEKEEDG